MWIFGYGSLVWKADFPFTKKIVGYIKGYERKFWQASVDHRGIPGKPGRVVTLIPSNDPEAKVWGTAYKIHRRDIEDVVKHLDLREVGGYEKTPVEFYPVPNHKLNLYEVYSSTSISIGSNSGPSINGGHSNGVSVNVSSTTTIETTTTTTNGTLLPEKEIPHSNHSKTTNGVNGVKSHHSHNEILAPSSNGHLSDSDTSDKEDEINDIIEGLRQGGHFRVIMYYGNSENVHFLGPAPVEEMVTQIYESVGVSGTNKEYLYNLASAMREICDEANDAHLIELETHVRKLEISLSKAKSGRSTPIEL